MNPNNNIFEIKQLAINDLPLFKALIHLFNLVFEEEVTNIGIDENLSRLLGEARFIVMVALHENAVIGGLTAYELPLYYSQHAEIFVYDLAVDTEYQRKGIGKRLIQTLKEYCAE